ncbi:hypothetical protein [Rhodococcus wratislaviensis]|uniref:hypothetical protein n=1 Tax=Rhodococcus wratislaviensis TaxID=44752 RepID=UPI00365A6DEF
MSISDCGSSRKVEALVDRDLCPVTGATKLGVEVRIVGAAIRAHKARRVDEEHPNLIRSEPVFRPLESGQQRHCTEIEMRTVRYVAFRAVKNLSRGASADDLSGGELSTLRGAGVDPGDHSTWPLHTSGCDGTRKAFGIGCCDRDYCRQLGETRFVRLPFVPGRPA